MARVQIDNGDTGNTPTPSTIPATSPAPATDSKAADNPAAPAKPAGMSDGSGNDIKSTPGLTQADLDAALAKQSSTLQQQFDTLQTNQAAATGQAQLDKQVSDQNAVQLLSSTFQGYGLENSATGPSLSNAILGLIQNNYDSSTIQALIEDPTAANSKDQNVAALGKAWQTRFAGNVTRIANGQSPLSPSEYIATEKSYQDIIQAAGLPKGFYDNSAHMAQLIGNDVAPTELQDRINTAAKSISNADPFYTSTLQQYYGLSASDMIAHALDPNTALPLLQRATAAATFGAAGARQNVSVDQATAAQYAALGVTQGQAEQGFQSIASALPTEQKLASIYGGTGTQFGSAGQQQANLTAATFGGAGGAEAEQQLKKLQQQEVNAFSGSSGVDKNSLFGSTAGTF